MFDSMCSEAVEALSWFCIEGFAKFWSDVFGTRLIMCICDSISLFVGVDPVFVFRKDSSVGFGCWYSCIEGRAFRLNLWPGISYCVNTFKGLSKLNWFSSGRFDIEDICSMLPAAKLTRFCGCFIDLSRIDIGIFLLPCVFTWISEGKILIWIFGGINWCGNVISSSELNRIDEFEWLGMFWSNIPYWKVCFSDCINVDDWIFTYERIEWFASSSERVSCIWGFKLSFAKNVMSHWWYLKVFSSSHVFVGVVKLKSYGLHIWVSSCLLKSSDCVKTFEHLAHLNVVSLLCEHSCFFKYWELEKVLEHLSHFNCLSSLWMRKCIFKFPDCLKVLVHLLHLYGFSPVWMRKWSFKCPDFLKALGHLLHLNGLSPVWMRKCIFKLSDRLKVLGHLLHLNGLSPVWMRKCIFKSSDRVKASWHWIHLNGLSPVWMRKCIFKCCANLKALGQLLHLNGFSPLWMRKCLFKYWDNLKALGQLLHLNGFSSSCKCLWLFK